MEAIDGKERGVKDERAHAVSTGTTDTRFIGVDDLKRGIMNNSYGHFSGLDSGQSIEYKNDYRR